MESEHEGKGLRNRWDRFHDQIQTWDWFSRVGEPIRHLAEEDQPWRVWNWVQARHWATANISWWCLNEASNLLREFLHVNDHKRYQLWNEHVQAIDESLAPIIESVVRPALPDSFGVELVDWIRSLLQRASMELAYKYIAPVRIACCLRAVEWFALGYSPCGWIAATENNFPLKSRLIVF
ncbi:hypothetical protein [Tuwongella immobilis]|uniref:Uncharacterized protein n=1 Tax=Tuwongella immobilis TaxID=692036 RepID=A0A6C2YSW1_9BACT|nr:hypothetical protein [Tuwongella immobilis]VIP04417.1 unnamed protein product [Tuwongella immobilis]VTS06196.1 unnamed protein product [Tuwongella immobilis]